MSPSAPGAPRDSRPPSHDGGGASDAPSAKLLEGTPYRLIGLLGAGGMGEVLEAEHRALGHRVVVKVMRAELDQRPDMRDRMRIEAQSLARIRHPHLVMVTDYGETAAGRPYLVMERLAGRSLREELLLRTVLPVAEAAEIARQMLLGLAAAHDAGLVHRDVKPDNVFLCAGGGGKPIVKILDFGVVKIAQAGRDPRTPLPLVMPTSDGVLIGTPRYLSPEQARGDRDLDARSDVYAVGLVLYAMLVGHGPFDHLRDARELYRAHMATVPVPPSHCAPQRVPDELNDMVKRALAKVRDERFPSALSFAVELQRFLGVVDPEGRVSNPGAQIIVPPRAARSIAEAATAPAASVRDPDVTATASPVAPGPRSNTSRTIEMTATDGETLDDESGAAASQPRSAPSQSAPTRSSVPETVPMLELSPQLREAIAASPLSGPAQPPSSAARPGGGAPLPAGAPGPSSGMHPLAQTGARSSFRTTPLPVIPEPAAPIAIAPPPAPLHGQSATPRWVVPVVIAGAVVMLLGIAVVLLVLLA